MNRKWLAGPYKLADFHEARTTTVHGLLYYSLHLKPVTFCILKSENRHTHLKSKACNDTNNDTKYTHHTHTHTHTQHTHNTHTACSLALGHAIFRISDVLIIKPPSLLCPPPTRSYRELKMTKTVERTTWHVARLERVHCKHHQKRQLSTAIF